MKTQEIKQFQLGELFCGPGGLAYAATTAKIEDSNYKIVHKWANDYDLDTCRTYIRNICPDDEESVIHKDVRKLEIEKLGKIDALVFGFPCNDFSVVGEQKGFEGTFGPLYTYGVKVLKEYEPQWFLAENVGGLRSANDGKAFEKIQEDLKEAGYRIYPNLYKFEEYGVPQARHRMIIVGIKDRLPYEFRIPSTKPYRDIDTSCKTAIEQPPIPKDAPNNELTKQSATVVERLSYIKPGQNAFTADIPEHLQLHVRARLQTFPDSYVFEGSKESVRKQIGMAVPPEGARIIFEAILKTFAGIDYEWMPASIKE